MKQLGLLGFICLTALGVSAQNLSLNTDSINYGLTFENLPDSVQVTVTNTSGGPINVSEIRFFDIYGQAPFTTTQGAFSLNTGQSQDFWVRFQPDHNIVHNTEVVVITEKSGAFSLDLRGIGRYQNGYYSPTNDLDEQALKSAMKTLLASNYNSLGYNSARDEMYMVIDNKKVNGQGSAQNQFESVYIGAVHTGYVSRTDAQNQGYNTEHTFPQGFFSSNEPERSDIHHLFITNGSANSTRGNDPFGIVTSAGWSQGGSKQGGGTFEPRDAQKGPSARAMMYFVTRYQDYANHFAPQETILRQWHKDFPPNAIQEQRNQDIFSVQNNRNPFVDYPQFVDRITTLVGNSVAPDNPQLFVAADTIFFSDMSTADTGHFNLVLVNHGNEDIELSNFLVALTAGQSILGLPTAPVTLLPGEDLSLPLRFITNQSGGINTTLQFSTDLPNSPGMISIPIIGEVVVGIPKVSKNQPVVTFFPNPASGEVHLNTEAAEQAFLIFDLQGRQRLTGVLRQSRTSLDLSSWESGVYFLHFPNGSATSVEKLILIH